jgi:Domain of unknown function (DUF5668)
VIDLACELGSNVQKLVPLAARDVDSSRRVSIRRSPLAALRSPGSTDVTDSPELLMQSLPQMNKRKQPGAYVALGLIAFGAMALLDRLHLFSQPLLNSLWPLALVLAGLARLGWQRRNGGGFAGVALIVAGGLLTANNLGIAAVSMDDCWPVFVILAGLGMLLRGPLPRS